MSQHTLSVLVENKPGVLARIAGLFARRGFNIHSLAVGETEHVEISRITVVVDVEDRPGVLADLTRKIAKAGVNLDLVYVATRNRVVFGAGDLTALKAVLGATD